MNRKLKLFLFIDTNRNRKLEKTNLDPLSTQFQNLVSKFDSAFNLNLVSSASPGTFQQKSRSELEEPSRWADKRAAARRRAHMPGGGQMQRGGGDRVGPRRPRARLYRLDYFLWLVRAQYTAVSPLSLSATI